MSDKQITLDLSIEKVAEFLERLPDNYLINGGSVENCCLCLYALHSIENLSLTQELEEKFNDGHHEEEYLSFASKGWADCDFNRLQYWTILDAEIPSIEVILPEWCRKFNFEQQKLGIAKVAEFKALIRKMISAYSGDPRLQKFLK